jgi:hypothetical protein
MGKFHIKIGSNIAKRSFFVLDLSAFGCGEISGIYFGNISRFFWDE